MGSSWQLASRGLLFRSVGNYQALAFLLYLGRHHHIWNHQSILTQDQAASPTSRVFGRYGTLGGSFASIALHDLHVHLIFLTESILCPARHPNPSNTGSPSSPPSRDGPHKNKSTFPKPPRLSSQLRKFS